MKFICHLGVLALVAAETCAQEQLRTHYGTAHNQVRGAVDLDDVDGDGVREYTVRTDYMVLTYSGQTGQLLWRRGTADYNTSSITSLGDWSGDGIRDLAIGIPGWTGSVLDEGRVEVVCGATGRLIVGIAGGPNMFLLGKLVADAGDVNGDGVGDLLVGSEAAFASDTRVYLGPNASLQYLHDGAGVGSASGMEGLGDINGDGKGDYIIGWQRESNQGPGRGVIRVYSGASGGVIHQLYGLEDHDYFGRSVANAGDVDMDGVNDFWVGAPQGLDGAVSPGPGFADLYSGATASLLRRVETCRYDLPGAACPVAALGNWIVGGHDVNADGRPDALIGSYYESLASVPLSYSGSVSVLSGATGHRLWQKFGGDTPLGDERRIGLEQSFAILDDLTGDGYPEFAIAYQHAEYDVLEPGGGRIRIFKGGPGDAYDACTTTPNSVGSGGLFELPYAISASSNVLRLRATRVPAGQTGVFLYGPQGNSVPFGDGELCIAPPIVRMGAPVAITTKNVAWLDVDLQTGPFVTGPAPLLSGITWRFQFWYRDPMGPGGGGVNLTDAKDITITP